MSSKYVKTLPLLSTVEQVEATVGRPNALINLKQLDRLDDDSATVLAHSPIAGFGYRDELGNRRATFVGGTPGFVRVHTPRRISLPTPADEPGPISGGVSFVFLLPGVGETLRLNGAVTGQDRSRIQVEIQEAYVHCPRCILRSRLWEPASTRRAPSAKPGAGPLGDPRVRDFLDTMPFFVVTTGDTIGGSDTSPRGDQPGFVRVLDGATVAIPDRKGNQRADTLHNLLQDDRIAIAALRPGRPQILRLHGTAAITADPDLLATMALRGMSPHAALLIKVDAAEVVENSAVTTARLWSSASHVDRKVVPDLTAMAAKQLAGNVHGAKGFLLKGVALLARPFSRLLGAQMRSVVRKEGYSPDPLGAPLSSREMTISAVRRENANAVTLVLEDGGRVIDFRPGQFFTLITEIDGRTVRRAYSASSAPGSPRLEVTVKRVDGGVFSAHANDVLRVGDRLSVRGPSGNLRATGPLVMIAAGSGITPIMSLIRSGLDGALLYGNRDADSILFADELDRLERSRPGLSVTHRLSRSGRGRLDAVAIGDWLETISASPAAQYVLCGPDPVMLAAHDVLVSRGVPADRIHRESYTSAVGFAEVATEPHPMTVEDDGHGVAVVTVEPGETLLSAGLAAGAPMPYSCTVGNCGECVVRLRSGSVALSCPNCLTPEQRADGLILTCVAQPSSAVTVDVGFQLR